MSDKYKLSWNSYTDHLQLLLQDMFKDESSKDVTLVCSDQIKLKAHKNVLKCCSDIFKQMLNVDGKEKHLMIFLKGVSSQELNPLLNFMYLGHASFDESRINEFLAVAEELRVKELCNYNDSVSQNSNDPSPLAKDESGEGTEVGVIQKEPRGDYKYSIKTSNGVRKEEIPVTTEEGQHMCPECGKYFKEIGNMRRHFYGIHKGETFTCAQCGKIFNDINNLGRHIKTVHDRSEVFSCLKCGRPFNQKGNRDKHLYICKG